MRMAPAFIFARVPAFISFAVAGVRGQWRETKSDWASRVSRSTYFASASPSGTAGAAVGKNIHAKGAGDVRHGLTDAPEADNAQRLPGQLHLRGVPEAEGAAAFPPASMYQRVVMADPVTQLQHQRERKLRHGGGTVGGDVGHGNAPAGAGGTVHGIVARRLNADQTDAGTGIQQPLGDGELVHQHDLTIRNAGNGFVLGVRAVVNGQFAELAERLVAQIAGI